VGAWAIFTARMKNAAAPPGYPKPDQFFVERSLIDQAPEVVMATTDGMGFKSCCAVLWSRLIVFRISGTPLEIGGCQRGRAFYGYFGGK